MKRAFVDVDTYASRNMDKDRNIDYQFWVNKTKENFNRLQKTILEFGIPEAASRNKDLNDIDNLPTA